MFFQDYGGSFSYPDADILYSGTKEITLRDIMAQPAAAANQIQKNIGQNWLPMSIRAFTISFTMRAFKRLLAKPINEVNRELVTGKGSLFGRSLGFKL